MSLEKLFEQMVNTQDGFEKEQIAKEIVNIVAVEDTMKHVGELLNNKLKCVDEPRLDEKWVMHNLPEALQLRKVN